MRRYLRRRQGVGEKRMDDAGLLLLWLSVLPASWLVQQLVWRSPALLRWRWHDARTAKAPPVKWAVMVSCCSCAALLIALGPTADARRLVLMAMATVLIALAFIDCRTLWLPDSLTLPLLWAGLLVNLHGALVPLADSVLGAVAGYLLLWGTNRLYVIYRQRQGIGQGDFKLLAALGAWGGWPLLPAMLLLASLCALAVWLPRSGAQRSSRQTPMPFGCFLALAGGLTLALSAGG
ncbi:peptidase, A24 family [Serratia odorifera DSM 4582]|uniref:Peptidase, A24 family n=2 Tax=Serratia odorifera TaxID=618 RepID=D4E509_SEROD|nr:peptidase, A24 family [Serratia odorifera DSM 4582]